MQSVHRARTRLVYFRGSAGECDWGSLLASIKHHKTLICNAKEAEQGWGEGGWVPKTKEKKLVIQRFFVIFGCQESGYK